MAYSKEQNDSKKYKFRDLKVYSSTEWLSDNKKRYKQVFEVKKVGYIYAELSLYNKNFDVDFWDVEISLVCYDTDIIPRKICELEFTKQVGKYDPIFYLREGWGSKTEGGFWKKGAYFWEAYVDGELVGTNYFYMEERPKTLNGPSKFVDLVSVQMTEGQSDEDDFRKNTFYHTFDGSKSRYIYFDMTLDNWVQNRPFYFEIFIRVYSEIGDLKAQLSKLTRFEKNESLLQISAGYGSNIPGSWGKGKYRVEIVAFDEILGRFNFWVADDFIEGNIELLDDEDSGLSKKPIIQPKQSFEELIADLDKFIGLDTIKNQVKQHAQYIKFLEIRRKKGFQDAEGINIHAVFTGNPGTGKTTIAKKLGELYASMGLLSKGHVVEVDRGDLVGEYIGQTAPKVKEAINSSRGGILFIDEAYALARSNEDTKDFGREAIEILIKEMSNGAGDLAVIVAGYPKEMKTFIDSNPGLRSRFKHYFEFPDYLPEELMQILSVATERLEVKLDEKATLAFEKIIVDAYRKRDRTFGNARFVYDQLEKAKMNLGLRIMARKSPLKLSHDVLMQITEADVLKVSQPRVSKNLDLSIDEKYLQESLIELDQLIGMDNIKSQIKDLIEVVRYYRISNKLTVSSFSLHTVMVGNPGTGKTTVARILAKIFKALGILERGHLVETDRQGLVAGFVGQTAIKTAEKLDEVKGGVLFIDEAYALSNFNGLQGDFGNEAIQTLLKRMEDDRGNFFLVVAGYPENMDVFLKANPGLKSRFDRTMVFQDYTQSQLVEIGTQMFAREGFKLHKEARTILEDRAGFMYQTRDKYFGNARTVRKLVQEVIQNQNKRLAGLVQQSGASKAELHLIRAEDFVYTPHAEEKDFYDRKRIGFGQ